ncbi:uncharacterized protein LOC127239475 [Andrographis paniculata]|uniref:uncharacterized protein LOC127239475 n=1 Tax=Andrographis paniculata TaxID=175694 RepID=UPI0021E94AF3|nr:uncharacterized protein LOC127239475 [Andrographis paniculata]
MRDLALQTPQRDQSSSARRLKSSSELNRNARKVTKKSLNPEFKAVSEEESVVTESLKEISDVSGDNSFSDSAEILITSLATPAADAYSTETVGVSSPALSLSSSSVVTSDKQEFVATSEPQVSYPELDFLKKIECVEAELVLKHLREARTEVLKSKDMGNSMKLLLDCLLDIIIDEFYGGVYKKKEWVDKLLSNMLKLSFMIGITFALFIIVFWIFNSDAAAAANAFPMDPTPT